MMPKLCLNKSVKNKVVAVIVAIAFCMQDSFVFAAGAMPFTTTDERGPISRKLDASTLSIPSKFGSIKEIIIRPNSKKTITHILDAHGVPGAQRSILQLIQFLSTTHGIDVVGLEGALGEFDPTLFRNYPDKEELGAVLNTYLASGELSGSIAASILDENKSKYVGVEDWDLYVEGLASFLEVQEQSPHIDGRIASIESRLSSLKLEYYSEKSKELDARISEWRKEDEKLLSLIQYVAEIMNPDELSHPSVSAVVNAIREEDLIDSVALDEEIRSLVDRVRTRISGREQISKLNGYTQAFETGAISRGIFVRSVVDLISASTELKRVSSELNDLVERDAFLQSLEGSVLFDELWQYISGVKKKVFLTNEERLIDEISEALQIIQKLGSLELSRAEWNTVQELEEANAATASVKDLISEAKEVTLELLHGDLLAPAFDFYDNAVKREKALFSNMMDFSERENYQNVVMLSGGFHLDGIREYASQYDVSLIIVSPRIDNIPKDLKYQEFMKGNVSWKSYFQVEDGVVDLFEAFSNATVDRLLEQSQTEGMLKQWRDKTIRSLFNEGRIAEASRYTRFLDQAQLKQFSQKTIEVKKSEWSSHLDEFLSHLKVLESKNQLNEQNIAQFLSQRAAQSTFTMAAATSVPVNRLPSSFVFPAERAELRTAPEFDLDDHLWTPDEWFAELAQESGRVVLFDQGDLDNLSIEAAKELREMFLENFRIAARPFEGTRNEDKSQWVTTSELGDLTGRANGHVGYWFTGKTNEPYRSIILDDARIIALRAVREHEMGHGEYSAVERLLGAPFTRAEINQIFRLASQQLSQSDRTPETRTPTAGVDVPWSEIYDNGEARIRGLRTALMHPHPPAGWFEDFSRRRLRQLWLEGGTRDRRTIRRIFRAARAKLYDTDEAIDPAEKRIIQGRYLENLFVNLRTKYSGDETYENVAAIVDREQWTVRYWALAGQMRNGFYEGGTIPWEHAVALGRDALDLDASYADHDVIRKIFQAGTLTNRQIDRIWSRQSASADAPTSSTTDEQPTTDDVTSEPSTPQDAALAATRTHSFARLPRALSDPIIPSTWYDSDGNFRDVSLVERSGIVITEANTPREFENAQFVLYETDEDLIPDERAVIRARFMENLFAKLAALGVTDLSEIAAQVRKIGPGGVLNTETLSPGMVSWWRSGGKGNTTFDVWEVAGMRYQYAVQLARYYETSLVRRRRLGAANRSATDEGAIARLLDPNLTADQVRRIWGERVTPVEPETPAEPEADTPVTREKHHEWQPFYNDGRARIHGLRTALGNPARPPAAWFEDVGMTRLHELWLDGITRDQRVVGGIFRAARDKLFDTEDALEPNEKKIIQARFLENLFVYLRRKYPNDEDYSRIAGIVGLSEWMVSWWSTIGQRQNGSYTGATIAWQHAVTLGRDALGLGGDVSDEDVVRRVFRASDLTDSQIARIWNIRRGRRIVVPPTPEAPVEPTTPPEEPSTPPAPAADTTPRFVALKEALTRPAIPVSWYELNEDDQPKFRRVSLVTDSGIFITGGQVRSEFATARDQLYDTDVDLTEDEKAIIRARLFENLFVVLETVGVTELPEIAAQVRKMGRGGELNTQTLSTGMILWWRNGAKGNSTYETWEVAKMRYPYAVQLARYYETLLVRKRKIRAADRSDTDEGAIARLLDPSLTDAQVRRIWGLEATLAASPTTEPGTPIEPEAAQRPLEFPGRTIFDQFLIYYHGNLPQIADVLETTVSQLEAWIVSNYSQRVYARIVENGNDVDETSDIATNYPGNIIFLSLLARYGGDEGIVARKLGRDRRAVRRWIRTKGHKAAVESYQQPERSRRRRELRTDVSVDAQRSEVRVALVQEPWLTDPDNTNWAEVSQPRRNALIKLFLRTNRLEADDVIQSGDRHNPLKAKPIPALDGKTLRGMYEYYDDLRRAREYPPYVTTARLLLYENDVPFTDGFEEVRRRLKDEDKIVEGARKDFKAIDDELKIELWLPLFETHEAGLYDIITKDYESIDADSLLALISQRFLDFRQEEGVSDFSLDQLQQMEEVLGKLWGRESKKFLINQITKRITKALVEKAEVRKARTEVPGVEIDTPVATYALYIAQEWLQTRISEIRRRLDASQPPVDGTLKSALRKTIALYSALSEHYAAIEKENYQQYLNRVDPAVLEDVSELEPDLQQLSRIDLENKVLLERDEWSRRISEKRKKEGKLESNIEPDDLPIDLKLHQLEGVHFGVTKGNVLISDQMGLGKTVEAIAIALVLAARKTSGSFQVAVIADATILEDTWEREITKFAPKPDFVRIPEVTGRKRVERILAARERALTKNKGVQFILINYETLRIKDEVKNDSGKERVEALNGIDVLKEEYGVQDAKDLEVAIRAAGRSSDKELERVQWIDLKVGDEVHRVRKSDTQETDGFLKVRARKHVDLTGTIWVGEQGVWTILHDLDPVRFPSKEAHKQEFPHDAPRQNAALNILLHDYLLRRTKHDVLSGLPDLKATRYISTDHDPYQKAEYDRLIREYDTVRGTAEAPSHRLALQSKLRLLNYGVDSLQGNEPLFDHVPRDAKGAAEYKFPPSPRLLKVVEVVREILSKVDEEGKDAGNKVAIIGSHNLPITQLEYLLRQEFSSDELRKVFGDDFAQEGVTSLRSWHTKGRSEIVRDANNNPKKRVFLSTNIARRGLNMKGYNHVILLDLPYTQEELTQTIERFHRLGQKQDEVHVYAMVTPGTVDDRVMEILENKRTTYEQVADGRLDAEGLSKQNERVVAEYIDQISDHKAEMGAMTHIYGISRSTESSQFVWDRYADKYAKNVKRYAAYSIAQLVWLYLFHLQREGVIDLHENNEWESLPMGPFTDFQALARLEKQLNQIGLKFSDIVLSGGDFSQRMRELGHQAMDELDIDVSSYAVDLVRDEYATDADGESRRANEKGVVINSQLGEYAAIPAKKGAGKGVSQRHWMLAQTINRVRKGGIGVLWVHNGEITPQAARFLQEHFPVRIIDHFTLTLDNLPSKRRDSMQNMSGIIFEKTEETGTGPGQVDLNVDFLKPLNIDPEAGQLGFQIRGRRQQSATQPSVSTQILYIPEEGEEPTSDISSWVNSGGQLVRNDPRPVIVQQSATEIAIEAFQAEMFEKLDGQPDDDIVRRLRHVTDQLIFLEAKIRYLRPIVRRLRRNEKQRDAWQKHEVEIKGMADGLDALIKKQEKPDKEIVIKEGLPQPGGGPKPNDEPVPPRAPTPVPEKFLNDNDLISVFRRAGFRFEVATVSEAVFDVAVVEEDAEGVDGRVVYVSEFLLKSFRGSDKTVRDIINLLLHGHLDSLYPEHRLEAAFVGVDRLQRRLDQLRSEIDQFDLQILENLDFGNNQDIFFSFMRLRELSTLDHDFSLVQPGGRFENQFRGFLKATRNSDATLPLGNELDGNAVSEVEADLEQRIEQVGGESDEFGIDDAWLRDFKTSHGDKFEHLISEKAGTDFELQGENVMGGGLRGISIVYTNEAGRQFELATLRAGVEKPGEHSQPWILNWQLARAPQFVGRYVRGTGFEGNYRSIVGRKGRISSYSLKARPEQIVEPGLILWSQDNDLDPLLLRRVGAREDNLLGVFELSAKGELSPEKSQPSAIIDLSTQTAQSTSVSHTEVTANFEEVAAGTQVNLSFRLNPGKTGTVRPYQAAFTAARKRRTRRELRLIEVAARIISDPTVAVEAAQTATRWIDRLGGLDAFAERFLDRFKGLLSDDQYVRAALLESSSGRTREVYIYLNTVLTDQGLSRAELRDRADAMTQSGIDALTADIVSGKVAKLSDIIFYEPEDADSKAGARLAEFIEAVSRAVQSRGDLDPRNFRFHLVTTNKRALLKLNLALSTIARASVQNYYVDGSEGSWEALSKQLNNRVIRNPKFADVYGVFFPNQSWLNINAALPRQRVVQSSDVAISQAIVTVPKLTHFFAQADTLDITTATLLRALPEFGPAISYQVGVGIVISRVLLNLISEFEANKQISASA